MIAAGSTQEQWVSVAVRPAQASGRDVVSSNVCQHLIPPHASCTSRFQPLHGNTWKKPDRKTYAKYQEKPSMAPGASLFSFLPPTRRQALPRAGACMPCFRYSPAIESAPKRIDIGP